MPCFKPKIIVYISCITKFESCMYRYHDIHDVFVSRVPNDSVCSLCGVLQMGPDNGHRLGWVSKAGCTAGARPDGVPQLDGFDGVEQHDLHGEARRRRKRVHGVRSLIELGVADQILGDSPHRQGDKQNRKYCRAKRRHSTFPLCRATLVGHQSSKMAIAGVSWDSSTGAEEPAAV